MKNRATLLLLALAFAACAFPAPVDTPEQVRKAVQTALDRFVVAWKKLDVREASKVFESITTPDFVSTEVGTGLMTSRPQILATYRSRMKTISKVLIYETKITNLKVEGDKAKVALSSHVKTKVPEAGKPDHTMEIWQTSKGVWTKTKAGWKMKASATKMERALMDGEPMAAAGPKKKKGG